MVRLDMSEYMEKHMAVRLVGAPPGYVGYEEGGQLTEAIRRRPYSVVLLDEVEKAHRDVFNMLLQILDDGRITDSQGRVVDFRNTIIVMTSNIGSSLILGQLTEQETTQPTVKQQLERQLRAKIGQLIQAERAQLLAAHPVEEGASAPPESEAILTEMLAEFSPTPPPTPLNLGTKSFEQLLLSYFRPEFLNRIDERIIFKPLQRDELQQIVGIQIQRIQKLLAEQDLAIELTDAAQDYLVEVGYDPVYGARPLKRAIQRELENPIATQILANNFTAQDTILVDVADAALTFTAKSCPDQTPETQMGEEE
jgi:ATP-dependent Clp protease ATP-binding subunit ClpA